MSQKIDQDHGRFRQIIRGKIKQNLRKYISQGEMIGAEGQGHRLDPAPADRHPALPLRRQAAGRRRAGRRRAGDPLGAGRRGAAGRRARPATGPGEHLLEVEVTLDELAEILGEELELPRIQPKGNEQDRRARRTATPASARPAPSRCATSGARTAQALQAPDLDGHLRPEEPGHRPDPRRQALPLAGRPSREPQSQRRHHLHDGRVGLDGRRAEGDRAHRELLDRYLAAARSTRASRAATSSTTRWRKRGRSRHLLPHARVGRHDDLARLQAVREDHRRRLPGRASGTSTRSTSPTATTGRSTTRSPASSS